MKSEKFNKIVCVCLETNNERKKNNKVYIYCYNDKERKQWFQMKEKKNKKELKKTE